MRWALLLVLAQDDPVKVKEPDFEKAKGQFEKYVRATKDLEAGAFERALATAKELLGDASVAAFADRRVQVVRLDRMTRAWSQPVGDPREFYPKQLAARCMLELSKSEDDPRKRLAVLEEAKSLIQASEVESSRRYETSIAAEHERVRKAGETPREDPSAPVIREAERLQDAKDFKGALGHLEKNKAVLGQSFDSVRRDIEKAQERHLADLASEAKSFLEKLRPEEKLETLARSIKAFLPDSDKFTSIGADLECLRALAGLVERHKAAEYFESVPIAQLTKDLEPLFKSAMAREDVPQARMVIRIRAHACLAAAKGWVDRASKEPSAQLEKHREALAGLSGPLGVDLASLKKEAETTPDAGRRTFLGKVSAEFEGALAALSEHSRRMPMAEPAVESIRKAVGEGDASIFGPESSGSYRSVIAKLKGLMDGADSVRWHPEIKSAGRSLLAILIALEGFRDGRASQEIAGDCRPFVGHDLKLVLDVPPKVSRLLNGLKP
ncbi:MAG TPA: hypothetical protein VI643_02860 [Planctomycetota bacterium]|nr:hypothetical protein [Planctomycetota bacterium]